MCYDLHGSWNHFVGPNAALYDDGKDSELTAAALHDAPSTTGIGYLNIDWAYHYYRGAMQAGRINIGVPYYTRGRKDVTGRHERVVGQGAPTTDCPPGLGARPRAVTARPASTTSGTT